jgi:hypothetical protein
MSNPSKYNFPNAQKVQVFEQVDTYNENHYPIDPEVNSAIANFRTILTNLQTQHPTVTTETQALEIIEAEIATLQTTTPSRWQTIRPQISILKRQLLNPERHAQAIKATLGEIAKHYLEESVWAKALLTYLDKFSEEPNHGI